ncbi:hypothetical protein DBV15_07649 [Temnothorax longispinosus]|uniref:Uncharacterized protein n=1 Tax=Temnothorax longispinosus TaxID=300112 RepID=A0A4S2L0H8_9HYME|nr:hypothetical protein DBV15_07649 [Temnothorax longispinosus]
MLSYFRITPKPLHSMLYIHDSQLRSPINLHIYAIAPGGKRNANSAVANVDVRENHSSSSKRVRMIRSSFGMSLIYSQREFVVQFTHPRIRSSSHIYGLLFSIVVAQVSSCSKT